MKKITMQLPASPAKDLPIVIGADFLPALEIFLTPKQNLVIITDHRLQKMYGDQLCARLQQRGFHAWLFSFPAGEKSKNAKTKEHLETALLTHGCGRDTTLLALGGGVVGDLTGFVAATYLRGIPYVQLPTTLLAMVDSSIGGKTGLNTPLGKNLIGAFWQPAAVMMNLQFLETLPKKEIINGLIEVVKIFLARDAVGFHFLQQHWKALLQADISLLQEVIVSAAQLKIKIVEQDEKEIGARMILNIGHTIGHAIEVVSRYKIMHGYAVALGILVELKISEQLGIGSARAYAVMRDFFSKLKITPSLLATIDFSKLLEATRHDKKNRANKVHYVLLRDIGAIALTEEGTLAHAVEDAIVLQALGAVLSE